MVTHLFREKKLIKIGASLTCHAGDVTLQLAVLFVTTFSTNSREFSTLACCNLPKMSSLVHPESPESEHVQQQTQ
ncbi:MAG: hypothetical protein RLO18_24495, partial [Gimesia chilikensis]